MTRTWEQRQKDKEQALINDLYAEDGQEKDWLRELRDAVENNMVSYIYELLDVKKLDVNAAIDDKNNTLLHHAIKHHATEAVVALIASGADLCAQNADGEYGTPLVYAAWCDHAAIVEVIIKNMYEKVTNEKAMTENLIDQLKLGLKCSGAHFGYLSMKKILPWLKKFRDEGYAISFAEITKANSPLHVAAYYEDIDAIETCLDLGYCIDIRNYDKETPLEKAIGMKKNKAIKCLLDHGADLEKPFGLTDSTCLGYALSTDNHKGVHLILAAWEERSPHDKGYLNRPVNRLAGVPPLFAALRGKHKECLFALLAAGCDISAKTPQGESWMDELFSAQPFTDDHKLMLCVMRYAMSSRFDPEDYAVFVDPAVRTQKLVDNFHQALKDDVPGGTFLPAAGLSVDGLKADTEAFMKSLADRDACAARRHRFLMWRSDRREKKCMFVVCPGNDNRSIQKNPN